MLTTILDTIATILLYNFFIPFLTIPLYLTILWLVLPRMHVEMWLKVVASIVALPLLHVLVVLASLLFMIVASKFTGVIYWAS